MVPSCMVSNSADCVLGVARFEPQSDDAVGRKPVPLEDLLANSGGGPPRSPRAADQPPETPTEKSYTERLLEAKKKAWKDKNA